MYSNFILYSKLEINTNNNDLILLRKFNLYSPAFIGPTIILVHSNHIIAH